MNILGLIFPILIAAGIGYVLIAMIYKIDELDKRVKELEDANKS